MLDSLESADSGNEIIYDRSRKVDGKNIAYWSYTAPKGALKKSTEDSIVDLIISKAFEANSQNSLLFPIFDFSESKPTFSTNIRKVGNVQGYLGPQIIVVGDYEIGLKLFGKFFSTMFGSKLHFVKTVEEGSQLREKLIQQLTDEQ